MYVFPPKKVLHSYLCVYFIDDNVHELMVPFFSVETILLTLWEGGKSWTCNRTRSSSYLCKLKKFPLRGSFLKLWAMRRAMSRSRVKLVCILQKMSQQKDDKSLLCVNQWKCCLTFCTSFTDFCNLSTASTCSSGPVLVTEEKRFHSVKLRLLIEKKCWLFWWICLLEQSHQRTLGAVALLCIFQHSVSRQEYQIGFIFLSFFCPQQLNYLKSKSITASYAN